MVILLQQKNFGPNVIYFALGMTEEPEKRPAGGLLADNIVFWNRKSSRRGLWGKIFDKLRIRGRMQIFEKKSQKALNHVLIG